jgi:F0F1-type ATP synthase alpha subunit
LDNLSASQIKRFKAEIFDFVNKNYPEFSLQLRSTHQLSEEMKEKLDSIFKLYFEELLK